MRCSTYIELEKHPEERKVDDPGRLYPGSRYTDVAGLASRLRLLGDLPESAVIAPAEKMYQGPLVDAVKHFQQRHGLRPIGELDSATVAEMNVPLSDRVEQMRMAFERFRWLPYEFKQPPIVVNIPEFRLDAFKEGNELAFTMNVNVGD